MRTLLPTNLFFLLMIDSSLTLQQQRGMGAAEQVPCYFIFGDSLVDSGNNNNLLTSSKTNYLPYGIDFPGGPTGRFTNGLTTADIVGQYLGFINFIPPYATASGLDILRGVNYASGSAGILDITAYNGGDRISMDKQLSNHQETITKIEFILGKPATQNLLTKCIYSVTIGNNDYINNYFMPLAYPSSTLLTPDAFASFLIQKYTQQLETLYNQGARKVAVYGLGLIGCSPAELVRFPTIGMSCVGKINVDVAIFNNKLIFLIFQLNSQLLGAKFTYIGVYSSSSLRLGALDNHGSCCEIDLSTGLCRALGGSCPFRNSKVYWDGFHPTEAANEVFATFAYKAQTFADAFPYDISQLVTMF